MLIQLVTERAGIDYRTATSSAKPVTWLVRFLQRDLDPA
jgi:hypothetical protein